VMSQKNGSPWPKSKIAASWGANKLPYEP
jgi:hypothetical protein